MIIVISVFKIGKLFIAYISTFLKMQFNFNIINNISIFDVFDYIGIIDIKKNQLICKK